MFMKVPPPDQKTTIPQNPSLPTVQVQPSSNYLLPATLVPGKSPTIMLPKPTVVVPEFSFVPQATPEGTVDHEIALA